jgi:hypothetical protein
MQRTISCFTNNLSLHNRQETQDGRTVPALESQTNSMRALAAALSAALGQNVSLFFEPYGGKTEDDLPCQLLT